MSVDFATSARSKVPYGASVSGRRAHRVATIKALWRAGGAHPYAIFQGRWVCGGWFRGREGSRFYLLADPGDLPVCSKCENPNLSLFQRKAHAAVTKAIGRGELERQPCEVCGCPPGTNGRRERVLAHHDDYGFPLRVRWLCTTCHADWHKTNVASYTGLVA